MNFMPRHAIAEYLQRLREMLLSLNPDMATDEQLLLDTLDGQTDVLDQLRTIVRAAIEAEMFAEALLRRKKALDERKARFEARAEACRNTVREALQALELEKLTAEDFTASIAEGRPKVHVPDLDLLPPQFIRREARLLEIGRALKNGETVTGASFGNASPILVIKKV